jgi:uncharacterized protein YidB (DUF937 family)
VPDKKLLTAAALTAALAVGGAGGALLGRPLMSSAQQSDDPTTTTDDHGGEHRGGARFGLEAAAGALGISADELRDSLQDDKTIADVAEERGVELQTVIDAMVADATERIDQRVADGDLDADRAASLKEDLPDRITDVVNGEGGFGHRGGFPFAGTSAAAEALGMTAADLRAELRDVKTIAQVAEERGVELQAVVDAMVADATERIDERAADAKEDLPDRIADIVNGEVPDHPGPGPHGGARFGLEAAAEALGISADDLRDSLQDDKTIADVAGERGVDVQTVIDAMVADATERIDQRVADGDLDADRAASLKEDLPDRITDVVNGEAGPRFGHGPGGPGGPFGPGD